MGFHLAVNTGKHHRPVRGLRRRHRRRHRRQTFLLVYKYPALSLINPPFLWPLHDIAIPNIVWCMAYKGRVGDWAYIARCSCNSIAIG